MLAVEAASLLAACGGENGAAGPRDGGAKIRAPVPGGDETAFVPEVEHALDTAAGETHGLKLVAATVLWAAEGAIWLVAVKNEGMKNVCDVSIAATFQDANMATLEAAHAWVQAPMHRIDNVGLDACIAAGEVGVGMGFLTLSAGAAPSVHRVVYRPVGRVRETATRLSDVTLDDIVIDDPGADATFVRATITNRGTNIAQNVTVLMFILNKVGRPFSFGLDGPTMPMAPGSRSDFFTAVFGPVDRFVVFPQYAY